MKKQLDKKEKLLINEKPVGTNNLSSRASFMQEKLYYQKAYDSVEFYMYGSPSNFRYDAPFYGRIDEQTIPVIPKNDSLVQIKRSEEIVKCQNFVNDAFEDFFNFWQLSKRRGFLEENSPYYDIKAVQGYINPEDLYRRYMNKQNDQFYQFIKRKNISKDIKTFKDFIRAWCQFTDDKTPFLPFTFSSFCLSKFSDPMINGLTIDLSDEDKTNDENKVDKFIKDPNFIFFYNSAVNFGFTVDKNIPWRLVSNIDSPITKQYLSKYNLKSSNLYQNNFIRSYLLDLNLLINILNSFYLNFIKNNNFISKPKISQCQDQNFKIKTEIIFREELPKTDQNLYIRLYLFLKGREGNTTWDQSSFEAFVRKTQQILGGLDTDKAMIYVHNTLNAKIKSNKKNTGFAF